MQYQLDPLAPNGISKVTTSVTYQTGGSSEGGGGAAVWGDITGTLSAQTDLQTVLDAKTDGAASSTDNALARFHSTTGKVIQNSSATLDDAGLLTVNAMDSTNGTSGRLIIGQLFGFPIMGVYNDASHVQVAFGFFPSGLAIALGLPTAAMVSGPGDADSIDTALVRTGAGIWDVRGGSSFADLGNINTLMLRRNAGTPESSVSAPVGAICHDTTNGDLYVKETGTGNTGWVKLVKATSGITVIDAGDDLSTSRPTGVGVVYWVFDDPTVDAGASGENIVNGQDGDLWYVPDA